VDFLKVDRTFVAGLGTNPADTAIVRAVLDLGEALGLTTVAEGVETPEQLEALRDLGCRWAQGYHLARPGPPETVTTLLKGGTRW
jgi:EAL domain-containing protein (putative c-di-GMP-specific phosphodiesterase class I)